jgi:hypothetical protein
MAVKAREAASSAPGDLLIRCLSAGRKPLAVDREPVDWGKVVDIATREHVAPLLYKRLKETDESSLVPDDEWKLLRRAYFTNSDRNVRLFRELRTVLDCLRGSDIKVIVLKGAHLAEAVYGDIALRSMCDVDLLVQRTDLEKAEAALLALSAVQPNQYRPAPPAGDARCVDAEPDVGTGRHVQPIQIHDLTVELHWTITSETGPFRIDDAGFWERACPINVAGVEVLALSPADLVLHLCLHLCHSDWLAGLRSLCDLAEAIHRYGGDMDWTQVAERARDWGASRYVGLTLCLAKTLLGAEVPGDVLEQLVPGGIEPHVLEAAKESVVTRTGYGPRVPSLYPSGARSLGGEARWFRNRVFLSREEMAAKYPASRNSKYFRLYYVLRLRDALRVCPSYARILARFMMAGLRRSRYAALSTWLKSGKA